MKSLTCKLVRDFNKYEACSCVSPEETELGFRVLTLVTYRGISLNFKYLEQHEGISLFFDVEGGYRMFKGRKQVFCESCPPSVSDVIKNSTDKLLLFHSTCDQAMRVARAAAWDAWDAWDARAPRAAAWDAAREAAWTAAWDAAWDVRNARDAAWNAAWDARDAAWDADWDATRAASKKAYRALILLRKTLKEGEQE